MSEVESLQQEIATLRAQLADARQALDAMARGEADAVARRPGDQPVLLEQAQEQLRQSQRLLRSVFESALDPVFLFDDDLALVDANPATCELIGLERCQLIGRPLHRFVPESLDLTSLFEELSTRGRLQGQYPLRRWDGTERIADISAVARVAPGLHFGALRDVTARIEAQRRLEESERRYRRIVDNASEGLLMYDVEGTVTFMNPSMARMLGRSVAEGVGKSVFSFVHEEMRNLAHARFELDREAFGGEHEELRLVRADGTDLWVSLHVDVLRDEAGGFESALAMVTDITAWRQSRDALRSSEEQLRQAQKMEAVGSLAGGVAHDFNNLLSVILSYTSLMLGDLAADDPMRKDVEQVQTAGTRASELTSQLLAFSRKQVLQPEALDINHVLRGLEKMLSRMLGEHINVRLITAPDAGRVFADRGQLEQVVMNLAVNARDAMPEGGSLTFETSSILLDREFVRARPGLKPGPHVLLTVTDTGSGMEAPTLERIFEPFFTTKETGKGTGLGLSTVYGIVKQSDGYIWVYSEPDKGTTFKIYLPQSDRAVVHRSGAQSARSTVQGSETILLVEDESQVREITGQILRRNGYEVLDAQTPGEALLLCEQRQAPIHLLLSDVVMPQLSGPQLARRLTKLRPDMRVLFMSGYTEDSMLQSRAVDGDLNFLPKPVLPRALLEKVREVLERPARRGEEQP